ncbi:MAG: ATP-dependent DNA helicase RecG [Erysipelotrichaceae bacterium]
MKLSQLKLSKRLFEKLTDAGYETVESLLWKFPYRYEEVTNTPYSDWKLGDKVWLEGIIQEPFKCIRLPKNRTVTKFMFQSDQGLFQVSIFNRPWLKSNMQISLQARYDGNNNLIGINYNTHSLLEQLGIIPVYSLSKELSNKDYITAISKAINYLDECIKYDVPEEFRQRYKLLSLKQSVYQIHKPLNMNAIFLAKRALKYEEFLRFQTKLQLNRQVNFGQMFGKSKIFDRRIINGWMTHLPFVLTNEQKIVLDEILNDLQSKQRMNRLLQGDVGSGKTVIAALAIYATVLSHYQTALLVPTEILAKQHYVSIKSYLPDNIRVEVLYSSLSSKQKTSILDRLKNNEIDVLIGTHSIIQEDVKFYNCGLVVADEQHRFGVEQRRMLSDKGDKVDFLLMSATPIPRTLAAVLFNDLNISTITSYHASKQMIKTRLIQSNSIKPIYDTLIERLNQNDQIYFVCPSIEFDENRSVKSVDQIYQALVKGLPKNIRIGMLHGKLSQDEKDKVLQSFLEHKIDCLVTTTVIEVGVNVQTANTMVIYDSDRFGLSQLHQLRGRVGRGSVEGLCFLLTDSEDELSLERLKVLENSQDGFEIANKDLELRGPGEIFGLKQSGIPSFLIANVVLDQAILVTAQKDSIDIVNKQNQFRDWINYCLKDLENQRMD